MSDTIDLGNFSNAKKEIKELITEIEKIYLSIEKVNTSSIDLKGLKNQLDSSDKSIESLTNKIRLLEDALKKSASGAVENARVIANQQEKLDKQYEDSVERRVLWDEEANRDKRKQIAENAQIEKKVANERLSLIEKERSRLKELKQEYASLNLELKDKRSNGVVVSDSEAKKVASLAKEIKNLEQDLKDVASIDPIKKGAYDFLKSEIISTKNKAAELYAQIHSLERTNVGGANNTIIAKMKKDADDLVDSLSQMKVQQKKIEEATLGTANAQTHVATYSGISGALVMEMGRTISDIPYGIQGIANNLSQVGSLFALAVQEAGGKDGGGLKGAIKGIGAAFMGPLGILTLFQIFIALMQSDWFLNLFKANELLGSMRDQIQGVSEDYGAQIGKMRLLVAVAEDETRSKKTQKEAVKLLKEEYGLLNSQVKDLGKAYDISDEYVKNYTEKLKQMMITALAIKTAEAEGVELAHKYVESVTEFHLKKINFLHEKYADLREKGELARRLRSLKRMNPDNFDNQYVYVEGMGNRSTLGKDALKSASNDYKATLDEIKTVNNLSLKTPYDQIKSIQTFNRDSFFNSNDIVDVSQSLQKALDNGIALKEKINTTSSILSELVTEGLDTDKKKEKKGSKSKFTADKKEGYVEPLIDIEKEKRRINELAEIEGFLQKEYIFDTSDLSGNLAELKWYYDERYNLIKRKTELELEISKENAEKEKKQALFNYNNAIREAQEKYTKDTKSNKDSANTPAEKEKNQSIIDFNKTNTEKVAKANYDNIVAQIELNLLKLGNDAKNALSASEEDNKNKMKQSLEKNISSSIEAISTVLTDATEKATKTFETESEKVKGNFWMSKSQKEKRIKELGKERDISIGQAKVESATSVLDVYKKSSEITGVDVSKEITDTETKVAEEGKNLTKLKSKSPNEEKMGVWDYLSETNSVLNEAGALYDAFQERRLQEIDERIEKLKEEHELQLSNLDESTKRSLEAVALEDISAEEKARKASGIRKSEEAEKKRLQKEQIAREKELDKEKKRIAREQAKVQKALKIFEIITGTASAIANSGGNIAKIIFSSLTGAIQLATVAATPLPAFKDGGVMNKDGEMLINDGGSQEYVNRNGKILTTTTKNAIVKGQKGDIIYKNKDEMIKKLMIDGALKSTYGFISSNNDVKIDTTELKDVFSDEIKKGFRNVRINNVVNINNDYISYLNKRSQ